MSSKIWPLFLSCALLAAVLSSGCDDAGGPLTVVTYNAD